MKIHFCILVFYRTVTTGSTFFKSCVLCRVCVDTSCRGSRDRTRKQSICKVGVITTKDNNTCTSTLCPLEHLEKGGCKDSVRVTHFHRPFLTTRGSQDCHISLFLSLGYTHVQNLRLVATKLFGFHSLVSFSLSFLLLFFFPFSFGYLFVLRDLISNGMLHVQGLFTTFKHEDVSI